VWKKKENELPTPEPVSRPEPQAPRPTAPPRRSDRAIIGPTLKISGEVSGEEEIVVQGQIDGQIMVKGQGVTVGKSGKVKIESRLDYDSFLLDTKQPCVVAAAEAVRDVGLDPQYAIANGGVDANWTTKHGIPTVSLGCGQRNQHMVTEQLVVSEFVNACRIALRLASPEG